SSRRPAQARAGAELVRAARDGRCAVAARAGALSAPTVGAALRARVLLLPAGRPARGRDVPSRTAVDAPVRDRAAAGLAHARPSRVPLAARCRYGRNTRIGPAAARVLA